MRPQNVQEIMQAIRDRLPPRPEASPNQQRLDAIKFPAGNIPDDMFCLLSGEIMTDPVHFDGSSDVVMDRAQITHELSIRGLNPYTRQPAQVTDLLPAIDLKTRIDAFVVAQEKAHHAAAATKIQARARGMFARRRQLVNSLDPARRQLVIEHGYKPDQLVGLSPAQLSGLIVEKLDEIRSKPDYTSEDADRFEAEASKSSTSMM